MSTLSEEIAQSTVYQHLRYICVYAVHGLDMLQLTHEKEKSSEAQCSAGSFKNNFLECFSLLRNATRSIKGKNLMNNVMIVTGSHPMGKHIVTCQVHPVLVKTGLMHSPPGYMGGVMLHQVTGSL